MLNKKILAAVCACAFSAAVIALPDNAVDVEQPVMILDDSTIVDNASIDLSTHSFEFVDYEVADAPCNFKLVVAAHYKATQILPDKVMFVAGPTVVGIDANANMVRHNGQPKQHVEVGWQRSA